MVRGPVSLVIVGVLALFVFLLVSLGPRAFENVLPARAIAFLETMGDPQMLMDRGYATRGEEGRAPLDYLRDSSDGWKVSGPIAGLAGGGAAFVGDVIADYSARVRDAETGPLTVLAPLAGCLPTPPSAGAAFAHVGQRGDTGMTLALATYNDADLAQAVQVLVNVARDHGGRHRPSAAGLGYQSFDVAVTETAAPVYLVVEAGYGQQIVNLHLSPGARLERVVLLGGDQMGVANLPAGVPVEVLRGAELQACGLLPFHPLNPGHLYYQSVANGAIRPEEVAAKEAQFAAQVAAWDGWFRSAFGYGAGETLAGGWLGATAAVAGPLPATPEARAVFAPVKGAPVSLTQDQYLETPAMDRAGQGFAARVEAIAAAFAWGDLKNLTLEGGM